MLRFKEKLIESYGNTLIKNGASLNGRSSDGTLLLTTLLIEEKIKAANYIAKRGGFIDSEDLQVQAKDGSTLEELIKERGTESLKELIT